MAEVVLAPWYTQAPQMSMPKAPSTKYRPLCAKVLWRSRQSSLRAKKAKMAPAKAQRPKANMCGSTTPGAERATM
jgi:hypothetical protein